MTAAMRPETFAQSISGTRVAAGDIGTKRMHAARTWILGFVATVAAVVICYLWIDRPVSLIAHEHFAPFKLFERLTYIPDVISVLAVIAFIPFGLMILSGRPLTKLPTVVLLAGVTLATTEAIKDQLKFAFGRTWPETWTRNNSSLIHDNVYGFFPFHGGSGYASFPSGHTAAICSVMTVLWICYPRFRLFYAFAIAAVAIGLVGANFHFVGDVIAGGYLGCFMGWLVVTVWERGVHTLRPVSEPDAPRPTVADAPLAAE